MTSGLPAGTVTFFLTDLEGSTSLWDRAPQEMARALARHDEIVADAIARGGGRLVKSRGEGDSVFAVFARAPDAASAALELQRALHRESWPTPQPLRARIAIHSGEAELRSGDYFGPAVNRCARLRALAHGGQIVLSEASATLVEGSLPEGASLRDLGRQRLKDLSLPERVFQMLHQDLPAEFPPARSLDEAPNNLPVQLTSFIGRAREMSEVRDLLDRFHLVTLTGPGGSGKTRLAVQLGAELLDGFLDGVWLAELGSVRDPGLVPHAIASTLGVGEQVGRPIEETLIAHIGGRSILIVLDNCEHVADAAARTADRLLRACPRLRVLATSREALRIAGERVFTVSPLPTPVESDPLDELERNDAVRLFVDRAALHRGTSAFSTQTARAVATIARRLDGIPLALELAAARTRVLSPDQIAARLDDRFTVLSGGHRTAPAHQRTLRATVEWSHDLLSDPERALLRRLSVFAGFSLEAAEATCAFDGLQQGDVLDLLGQLVEKSVVTAEGEGDETRYRMLETVRAFASEKLSDPVERATAHRLHLGYFERLLEQAETHLPGREQERWLFTLDRERDNIRAALAWADVHAEDRVAVITEHLVRYWEVRGSFTEACRWLERTLEVPGLQVARRAGARYSLAQMRHWRGEIGVAMDLYELALADAATTGADDLRGAILCGIGDVHHGRGDYEAARIVYDEAHATAERLADKKLLRQVLRRRGNLAHAQRRYDEARRWYEESLALNRELGDEIQIAVSLQGLGTVADAQRDYPRARTLFEDSLSIVRRLGDRHLEAFVLNRLAGVLLEQGQIEAARDAAQRSLELRRDIDERAGIAVTLAMLGEIERVAGDPTRAEPYFKESESMFRGLGMKLGVRTALAALGSILFAQGETERARSAVLEALEINRELGDPQGVAQALEVFAPIGLATDPERSAMLLGAAAALREQVGAPVPPSVRARYEADVAAVRAALGEASFDAAWRKGKTLAAVDAIDLAKG